MTAEGWERVKSLFEAALEQAEAERAAFIAHAAPDDAEVRNEALRLLEEHGRLEAEFLKPPGQRTLLDWAARSLASQAAHRPGGELLAGRYLVEREIGRGGNGVVYLAHDRQLHSRRVVVKFLHAVWEDHDRIRRRFQHEIEALSRIQHAGVVGVLDVGQALDGRSFLVMEYVDGVTLRSRIDGGVLTFEQAGQIVESICEALEAAHGAGIFHRDLKPENVMLLMAGESVKAVKLIDFGIAKVENAGSGRTETVSITGTVRYIAPEQLIGRTGPQSDIYSLGVVCYEMLTGRLPYDPETPFQLYELQREGRPVPPSKIRKSVKRNVDAVILRALSFRPAERQSSARAFAREFLGVLRSRGKLSSKLSSAMPRWALASLLALSAVTAAAWQWVEHGWGFAYDRSIEFAGGRDPEELGFAIHLDLEERAVPAPDYTAFEAIRLITHDQGFYFHRLTPAQTYAAIRRGWTLRAAFRPAEGSTSVTADLTPASGRYDLVLFRDGAGRQIAQLTQRIATGVDGMRCVIEGPQDAIHEYEMRFDPRTSSARLLIDGVERLSGYGGHREYLERYGLTFGTSRYKSAKGEAIVKRVRFDVN